MRPTARKITVYVLFALTLVSLCFPVFSPSLQATAADETPYVSISASSIEVPLLQSVQLSAEVQNVNGSPSFQWKSSDPLKAMVDRSNGIRDFLKNRQVLSYKYSYQDDYYYANDKQSWQKAMGFSKFYDLVAPYALLETDYLRVKFPYGGKDYMIQFWKGQYGLLFYGSEIGIYTKKHSDKADGTFTLYKCASKDDFLNMDMTLYHDTTGFGTYERQFTRPYDSYWWCTGFKAGHLRVEEPARELRVESRITLKDDEMATQFCSALEQCGLTRITEGSIGVDQFRREGNDVRLVWQNLSHAETTMPVKIVAGANVLAFFMGPLAFLSTLLLDLGLLALVKA